MNYDKTLAKKLLHEFGDKLIDGSYDLRRSDIQKSKQILIAQSDAEVKRIDNLCKKESRDTLV